MRWQVCESTPVDNGLYRLNEVPSPHPEFTDYLVAWTPEAGVCAVIAFGERNESDAFGTDTRAEFETVAADLTATHWWFGPLLLVIVPVDHG